MNESIDMMLKYPSVLPVDCSSRKTYRGFLPIDGVDYKISIEESNGLLEVEITSQLQNCEEEIIQLQNTTSNVIDLLDGLKDILKTKSKNLDFSKNHSDKFKHILNEYVELKQFYINLEKCTISHNLSQINMSFKDEFGRLHDFVVNCQVDDPEIFQVSNHNLPEKKGKKLFSSSNSLKEMYEKFVSVVGRLQSFFDLMDVLDNNCWILDPDKPSRKDCYRRIGFDSSVSMILTIDPWSNTQVPDIKFLGPDRLIEGYREKCARNLIDWNLNNDDVLGELLKILELQNFPPRLMETSESEVLLCNVGECCICFSLRLNEKLPEIICPNRSCEQFFHTECLHQWLVSVSAKQSFNELHGQCPNCEKHITCPVK